MMLSIKQIKLQLLEEKPQKQKQKQKNEE